MFFHQLTNPNCRLELFACVVNELLALNEYLIPEHCLPPPHFHLSLARPISVSLGCAPFFCPALCVCGQHEARFGCKLHSGGRANGAERTYIAAGEAAARRQLERLKIESRQGPAAAATEAATATADPFR